MGYNVTVRGFTIWMNDHSVINTLAVLTLTWEWRKLHNEELSDLYSLPNIVRVVKSRRMR